MGQQSSVINGRFVQAKTAEKRLGYINLPLPTLNANGGGQKLTSYKGQLGLVDGDFLQAYSPGAGQWIKQTRVSECIGTRSTVSLQTQTVYNGDVFELAGIRVFAWQTNASTDNEGISYGNVFVTVQDAATGTFLIENALVSNNGANPRVVSGGTASSPSGIFQILWYVPNGKPSSNGNITFCTWSSTAPTVLTTPLSLITQAGPIFDVAPLVGDATFGAWNILWASRPVATDTATFSTYSGAAPVRQDNHAIFLFTGALPQMRACAVRGTAVSNTDNLTWLAFANVTSATTGPSGIRWASFTYGLTTGVMTVAGSGGTTLLATTPTNQQVWSLGIERADAAHAYITVNLASTLTAFATIQPNQMQWYQVSTTAVTNSTQPNIDSGIGVGYNCTQISKPFMVGSRLYVFCHVNDGLESEFSTTAGFGTQYLMDLQLDGVSDGYQQPRPVATLAPRVAGNFPTIQAFSAATEQIGPHTRGHLSGVTNPGNAAAGTYRTCGNVQSADGVVGFTAITNTLLDFTAPGRWLNFEIGDSMFLNGGVPSYYDGGQVVEAGYYYPPQHLSNTQVLVGGTALTPNQTYSYVFLWEWLDSKNQVHRGIASPIQQVAIGPGTNAVLWSAPSLTLTARQGVNFTDGSPVWLVPYRTAYLAGAMGSTFYRLFPGSPPQGLGVTNSVTGYGLTFQDSTPDSALPTNPVWLGSAGVVESQNPSSFVAAWKYNDRVFGIGDDTKTIWYSNQVLTGEPPLFNDDFTFTVTTLGPLTAGAQMDGYCVIFSATGLGTFTGEGPNNTNTNSDYTPFQQLTSDVGCIDPRSIVLTPMGIFFQSQRGIYLLTRALDLQYVGKNVEHVLALYPVITGATLVPAQNEVRFLCSPVGATSTSQGVTVRYNYLFDAWSTDQIYNFTGAIASCAFLTGTYINGTYYCAALNEQVYQESSTFFMDAGQYVSLSVASADFRPGGLNGWGRTRRVFFQGVSLDAHDLNIQVSNDFGATYTQSYTWTWPMIQRFTTARELVRMDLANPKSQAVRILITDLSPTGGGATTGQGTRFVGLTAEVGTYPGNYRLPAAQRG